MIQQFSEQELHAAAGEEVISCWHFRQSRRSEAFGVASPSAARLPPLSCVVGVVSRGVAKDIDVDRGVERDGLAELRRAGETRLVLAGVGGRGRASASKPPWCGGRACFPDADEARPCEAPQCRWATASL